ncbi:hypothetical protein [Dyella acidiphila]|uniref:Pyrroline-5-carboxylate reductase dimerisation domain-containing protein n=1 Tax=Dyella acidiphila TaxID=2775866 RepID=A0ABR9GA42_9GAMM|nr:hypothetical protein [Dyella acidiphila]MBE1160916.1 hypothetical protein [Dyella acidiphila]
MAAMFAEAASTLHGQEPDFKTLAREHTTPGGINELFCTVMGEERVWNAVDNGLERVRQRLLERGKSSG